MKFLNIRSLAVWGVVLIFVFAGFVFSASVLDAQDRTSITLDEKEDPGDNGDNGHDGNENGDNGNNGDGDEEPDMDQPEFSSPAQAARAHKIADLVARRYATNREEYREIYDKTLDRIEAAREDGMGWGELVKRAGFHPSVNGLGHGYGHGKPYHDPEIEHYQSTIRNRKRGHSGGYGWKGGRDSDDSPHQHGYKAKFRPRETNRHTVGSGGRGKGHGGGNSGGKGGGKGHGGGKGVGHGGGKGGKHK